MAKGSDQLREQLRERIAEALEHIATLLERLAPVQRMPEEQQTATGQGVMVETKDLEPGAPHKEEAEQLLKDGLEPDPADSNR